VSRTRPAPDEPRVDEASEHRGGDREHGEDEEPGGRESEESRGAIDPDRERPDRGDEQGPGRERRGERQRGAARGMAASGEPQDRAREPEVSNTTVTAAAVWTTEIAPLPGAPSVRASRMPSGIESAVLPTCAASTQAEPRRRTFAGVTAGADAAPVPPAAGVAPPGDSDVVDMRLVATPVRGVGEPLDRALQPLAEGARARDSR